MALVYSTLLYSSPLYSTFLCSNILLEQKREEQNIEEWSRVEQSQNKFFLNYLKKFFGLYSTLLYSTLQQIRVGVSVTTPYSYLIPPTHCGATWPYGFCIPGYSFTRVFSKYSNTRIISGVALPYCLCVPGSFRGPRGEVTTYNNPHTNT